MAPWWKGLSLGRVVHLVGASPAEILLSLEPLPADAPAIAVYDCTTPPRSEADAVGAILDNLEQVAVNVFPAWLFGAHDFGGFGGANAAAARALTRHLAARTPHFGPFLADLADPFLRYRPRLGGEAVHRPLPRIRLHAALSDLGAVFGPANVAIHRVAVAVELADTRTALAHIPAVDLRRMPPQLTERRARFLIGVARAHAHAHVKDDAAPWTRWSKRRVTRPRKSGRTGSPTGSCVTSSNGKTAHRACARWPLDATFEAKNTLGMSSADSGRPAARGDHPVQPE
jgi:hypothetical protein